MQQVILTFFPRYLKYFSNKEILKGVDYSTIERDYGGESSTNTLTRESNKNLDYKDSEKKSLNTNKIEISNLKTIVTEINTKDIKGPQTYKTNDLSYMNPDLPNIDISYDLKSDSHKNLEKNNFSINSSPKLPTNNKTKIQFPSKNDLSNPTPQQRYVSSKFSYNINLNLILYNY